MACATAKKDGSSRYANSIRARSTRLAGSVRERAIAPNSAKSVSPIANSIACRHAVMSSTLSANQSRKPRTHVGKCESSTYDGFHGIDVLVLALHFSGQVTCERIVALLNGMGIMISKRQVVRLLAAKLEIFRAEDEAVL